MNLLTQIAFAIALCAFIGVPFSTALPSLLGRRIRLESKSKNDWYMWRNKNNLCLSTKKRQKNQLQFMLDSSFDVVPGLSGTGISFRSINYPDHFIRHGKKMYLHRYSSKDKNFQEDASYIPRPPLARYKGCLSFESVNKPGHYLRLYKTSEVRLHRIIGSKSFFKSATWCPDIIKKVVVNGEWALLYGNDNAVTSGNYTIEIEEGVTVGTTESITRTVVNSWKFGIEAEASGSIFGISLSVKKMIETSGSVSVSRTSTSSWTKTRRKKQGYSARLTKGQPFYFWQWCVHAITADSTYIISKTDIYKQTKRYRPPSPLKSG